MILYLTIIGIAVVILIVLNLIFGFAGMPLWFAILGPILAVIASIFLDAIATLSVRMFGGKLNPFSKFFAERKGERKFYENMKVRVWKDKIPEFGKILHYFDKTKVEEKPNKEYFLKFMKETCIAEVMHVVTCPIALLVIFVFPLKYFWCLTLPVSVVNIFLQIPPIFVQRYTRPKLLKGYQRLEKYSQLENDSKSTKTEIKNK